MERASVINDSLTFCCCPGVNSSDQIRTASLKPLLQYLPYLPHRFLHLIVHIFDLLLQLLNVVEDLNPLFFYLCDFLFYLDAFQSLRDKAEYVQWKEMINLNQLTFINPHGSTGTAETIVGQLHSH